MIHLPGSLPYDLGRPTARRRLGSVLQLISTDREWSRVVATLRDGLRAWRTRSLADLDMSYVDLDGFALRVRSAGEVVSVPVLGAVGVLPDGRKHLLTLELCAGESFTAWKGCLDDLVSPGLRAPVLAVIDGSAGLRRAIGEIWPRAAVQRCSCRSAVQPRGERADPVASDRWLADNRGCAGPANIGCGIISWRRGPNESNSDDGDSLSPRRSAWLSATR